MLKKHPKNEKGQSLVELALTATLMIFLLMAVIDFGFGLLYWISIRDAAQEGAVYGSLHPGGGCETALRNRVRTSATTPLVRIDLLPDQQIDISRSGYTPGNTITVKVTHYYHILTPMISEFMGNTDLTLQTSVTNTILKTDPSCP